MTTVVGITSNTGVVLTSDSQWTSNVKAFSSKLFKINEAIGLGASGTRPYIKFLVERLGREIRTDDLAAEFKLKQRIDNTLCELYRESYREIDKTRLSTSRRSLRCNGIVGSKTI
jgi:20S proteasome alpha/beta subunit